MVDLKKTAYKSQESGDFPAAIKCFLNLAKDPKYSQEAYLEAAKCYKMMNLISEAFKYFEKLLNINPTHLEGIKETAQTGILSGQTDKALKILEKIPNKNPEARIKIASIYAAIDKTEKALKILRSLGKDFIDRVETYIITANIYMKRGEFEMARDYFTRALEKAPGNPAIFSGLGDISVELGEIERAIDYYNKALDFKEDNSRQIHMKLIELYNHKGDYERMNDEIKNAVSLSSESAFEKDVVLNECEILARKTKLESKVKRLWVTVTTRCNIRCITCGLWDNKWDLPYKTAREVMELYPYLERLVWLGGEVFLYKHFEEMFERAGKFPHLKQQIITNGVILTREWIQKIVKTPGVELTFSVDGATAEVYEKIRRGAKFNKLLENIRLTRKLMEKSDIKIDMRLNALIMKSNYHQMEDILDFAKREGFNQITYLALHLANAPEENLFYESRDTDAVKKVGAIIPQLRKKAMEYNMEIDVLLPPGEIDFQEAVSKEKKESVYKRNPIKEIYCKMPWKYMMICDNSDVLMTGSCIERIGNVNLNSLGNIWNSPGAVKYREKMIKQEHNEICREECISRW